MARLVGFVAQEADESARFSAFAFSYQDLVQELKIKYEGSGDDQVGIPTGFIVEGVFDATFWQIWWSASVDMMGCTLEDSPGNPNIRWANRPPIARDRESSKLHHKVMILDGHSDSAPAVIAGSSNWSVNADTENDENVLIIRDAGIADQFMQEFAARHYQAGGELYCIPGQIFADGFESGDTSAWSNSSETSTTIHSPLARTR